jgi:hypothetical protein
VKSSKYSFVTAYPFLRNEARPAANRDALTVLPQGGNVLQDRRGCDSGFFGENGMFDVRDLFQWERFITPSIIRVFYTLAVIVAIMAGISGIVSGLQLMPISPVAGVAMAVAAFIAAFVTILGIRIACEFVLIMFRMNDHLGVLRSRAEM